MKIILLKVHRYLQSQLTQRQKKYISNHDETNATHETQLK